MVCKLPVVLWVVLLNFNCSRIVTTGLNVLIEVVLRASRLRYTHRLRKKEL
jgi:hypothetical protein